LTIFITNLERAISRPWNSCLLSHIFESGGYPGRRPLGQRQAITPVNILAPEPVARPQAPAETPGSEPERSERTEIPHGEMTANTVREKRTENPYGKSDVKSVRKTQSV